MSLLHVSISFASSVSKKSPSRIHHFYTEQCNIAYISTVHPWENINIFIKRYMNGSPNYVQAQTASYKSENPQCCLRTVFLQIHKFELSFAKLKSLSVRQLTFPSIENCSNTFSDFKYMVENMYKFSPCKNRLLSERNVCLRTHRQLVAWVVRLLQFFNNSLQKEAFIGL